MINLQPGETYAMDTTWYPTRADRQLRDVSSAGVILTPLSVTASGNVLALTGSFGVFFLGKLQAHLFDAHGVEQQSAIDIEAVAPQTRVELRKEMNPQVRPARLSIHVVDDQGIDRGSLGEAAVPHVEP